MLGPLYRPLFLPLTSTLVSSFAPAGPLVSDLFDRANSAASLGTADTGQAWTAWDGTWGISTNKAYPVAVGAADATAVVNAGARGRFTAASITPAAAAYVGLVFRGIDASNHLIVDMSDTTVRILKRDAGAYTVLASSALAHAAGSAHSVTVECLGSVITVTVPSGTLSHTMSQADAIKFTATTAKFHGVRAGSVSAARVDNLSITQTDNTTPVTAPAVAAMPTYVGAGAAGLAAGVDATVSWPAGHQAGDLALLVVESALTTDVLTVPAGWTQVSGSPLSQATNTTANILYRRATSGAEADVTLTGPTNHKIGQIFVFRGVAASGDPWNVVASDIATASTAVSIPGATTTVNNCLVALVAFAAPDIGTAQYSGWTNADLANLTEREDSFTSAGNGGGFALATGEKATAGAFGVTTATLATSGGQVRFAIALRP